MKSTTLRRANLSREKIQTLENIAKYRRQIPQSNLPKVENNIKERELDMLWKNFKHANKQDKSPTVYLITGFIAGAIVMLLITTLISMSMNKINNSNDDITKAAESAIEQTDLTFIPADKDINDLATVTSTTESSSAIVPVQTSSSSKQEVYKVQSGDTLESIIIRFYGSYSKSHENAIKEANNMRNPNALSIGQKLIIPLH